MHRSDVMEEAMTYCCDDMDAAGAALTCYEPKNEGCQNDAILVEIMQVLMQAALVCKRKSRVHHGWIQASQVVWCS